jgi:hypothetical protein
MRIQTSLIESAATYAVVVVSFIIFIFIIKNKNRGVGTRAASEIYTLLNKMDL